MKAYYEQDGVTIYHGDAREVLADLVAAVDVVITDPVWPNAVACLYGADDPAGMFANIARHFPRLTKRVVVQIGCDSDPRFLTTVPPALPFFRACSLEYVCARPKGRILYTGDMAYAFGAPPPARPGRMVIPGRYVSTKADTKRPRTTLSRRKSFEGRWSQHPCPRRLEHVAWLVKWFADGLVLDPTMGIGTTLLAAKNAGLPAIGIEYEERFCEIAAKRMAQGVMFAAV